MKTITEYKKEDQDVLRTLCMGTNGKPIKDPHINYFLRQCEAKKIDPFSKMAYVTVRWDSKNKVERPIFQMGIDGARAIAARSGKLAGSDDIEYDDIDADFPRWARATVWRQVGEDRRPFTITLRFKEFKPAPPNDMQWNRMPYHMLGKCAEMAALRKAFPEDLQEVYEPSEPTDEDRQGQPETTPNVKTVTGEERWGKALVAFKKHDIDAAGILARVKKEKPADLTDEDFSDLFAWFEDLERGEETA